MDDRREHQRIALRVDIKISHPDIGEKIVKTKNFSEGGLFVLIEPSDLPAVGELVDGQVQGTTEDAPVVKMKIIRVANDGVGLQYVNTES